MAKENSGLRHDEIGLEVLSTRSGIKIWKNQRRICGIGQSGSISGLVLPGLEVHGFRGPDAEHDSQNFNV